MSIPRNLVELWLTAIHGAMCRHVGGGILVRMPALDALTTTTGREFSTLAIVIDETDPELEVEARHFFGSETPLILIFDDIKNPPRDAPELSFPLRRILSDLQTHLLDPANPVPADAELLAFALRHGDYRSPHVTTKRNVYHVVPHEDGWRLKSQSSTATTEDYRTKEEAIRAGAQQARSHPAGQLIIHNADGTFEESRSYG